MRDHLVPAGEARSIMLSLARPVGEESVPIGQCAGRVLARDLAARRSQPSFDASAMDGYALRQSDIAAGVPVLLRVIGVAAAGRPFSGKVDAGEAVRIFTGAPIPDGADTIIIQEDTSQVDDGIEILTQEQAGRYIRPAGMDFREGDILLHAGDILNPFRLSLAAAMNYAQLPVRRRPIIALVATGDELVQPGEIPSPGQIIASNSIGLGALIRNAGAEVIDLGIATDSTAVLEERFRAAFDQGADVLVTTGGASVGAHDLVKPTLEQAGARFEFARVAVRPGKPMLFGHWTKEGRTMLILGLAGNPVSSLVAATIFLRPLISALTGSGQEIAYQEGVLGCDLPANDMREEYMRARLETGADGPPLVIPFNRQDSAMLANLARANVLLIRSVNAPAARRGDKCRFIRLD